MTAHLKNESQTKDVALLTAHLKNESQTKDLKMVHTMHHFYCLLEENCMCDNILLFEYVHLLPAFYVDYKNYKEVMLNEDRQYLHIIMQYKGCNFLIPFRSEIKHKYAFKFKQKEQKGLDYSKALIIKDLKRYTIKSKKNIPQFQHDIIRKDQEIILRQFKKYVDDYCKFTEKNDLNFKKRVGKYSTLQNFHLELGIKLE
jgi:protein AbiQ